MGKTEKYDYGTSIRDDRIRGGRTESTHPNSKSIPGAGFKSEWYQDHHVIPKSQKNHPVIEMMRKEYEKEFNKNIKPDDSRWRSISNKEYLNRQSNIAILPTKEGVKHIKTERLVHESRKNWWHTDYNKYVKQRLDYIHEKCGGNVKEARKMYEQLNRDLRAKIGMDKTRLNERYPDDCSHLRSRNAKDTSSFQVSLRTHLANCVTNGLEKDRNSSSLKSQSHFSSSTPGGAKNGNIGGVAVTKNLFSGWSNSISYFTQPKHIICLSKDNVLDDQLISSKETRQIIKELINGIYVHDTLPFFSLHFNKDGSLYPIIHPAYENTLVGNTILMLDYYMKGFLNGGFYSKEFILNWDGNEIKNFDSNYLKQNLFDIKNEFDNGLWKSIKDKVGQYKSLRERSFEIGLESSFGLDDLELKESEDRDNPLVVSLRKAYDNLQNNHGLLFQTSFRILSKEKSAQCVDGVFIIDGGFEVKYTIEPTPHYSQFLHAYQEVFGYYPPEYQLQEQLYKESAESISKQMPLLPPFQRYFLQLGQISFLSSYLTTLKDCGQIPNLTIDDMNDYEVDPFIIKTPGCLPPLPVRYYKAYKITLTIEELLNTLKDTEHTLVYEHLKQYIKKTFKLSISNELVQKDQDLFDKIKLIIESLVYDKIKFKSEDSGPDDLNNSIKQYSGRLTKYFFDFLNPLIEVSNVSYYFYVLNIMVSALKNLKNKGIIKKLGSNYTKINDKFELVFGVYLPIVNFEVTESDILKFKGKCRENNIYLKDIDNCISNIFDSIRDIELGLQCDGCNGNFDQHSSSSELIFSKCRKNMENIVQAELNELLLNLRGQLSNSWLNFLFNFEIRKKIKVLEQLLESNHLLNDQMLIHLNDALRENCEKIKKFTLEKHNGYSNLLDDIFINSPEFLFKIIMDGRNIDLLHLLNVEGKSRNILNDFPNQESIFKKLFTVFPISKLEIANESFLNSTEGNGQRVWGGCGLILNQLEIEQFKNIKEVESFVNSVKSSTKEKPNQWVKIDKENIDSAFSIDIGTIDYSFGAMDETSDDSEDNQEEQLPYDGFSKVQLNDFDYLTSRDKFGNTKLHKAANEDYFEIIQEIVDKIGKKYLNAKNSSGLTPLGCSIMMGNVKSFEVLLSLGSDYSILGNNGMSPLYSAILEGYSEIAIKLIQHCGNHELDRKLNDNNTPLHISLITGQMNVALELIKRGASISITRNSDGFSAIEIAASLNQIEFFKGITHLEYEINRVLPSFGTALHVAVENGSYSVVEYLLENNWSSSIQQLDGSTPLMLALEKGYPEIASLILKVHPYLSNFKEPINENVNTYSLKLNTMGNFGSYINSKKQTATMISIKKGYTDISIKLLLLGNESWDYCDQNDFSILDYIILNGESNLLEFVLSQNMVSLECNKGLPNCYGKPSYLSFALQQKKLDLVDVLLKYGAVYSNSISNWTIYHMAARANHVGLISRWVEESKDKIFLNDFNLSIVDTIDGESKGLLEISIENGNFESLEILINSPFINEKRKHEIKSILCSNGKTHLLYYALISRSKRIIELLLQGWYEDLNEIKLNSSGDSVISILLSTQQHKLIPFFINYGLKVYQIGMSSIDLTVKLDLSDPIDSFIKYSNLELVKSGIKQLDGLFYFYLWLRSIQYGSKSILKKFNNSINLALSSFQSQKDDISYLDIISSVGTSVLYEVVSRGRIESFLELENIVQYMNKEGVLKSLLESIKKDEPLIFKQLLFISIEHFGISKNEYVSQCHLSKSFKCLEILGENKNNCLIIDGNILDNIYQLLTSFGDDDLLKLLTNLSKENDITKLKVKDISILNWTLSFFCEKSFEFCLKQGCDPLESNPNILFNLFDLCGQENFGKALLLLKNNIEPKILESMFNQPLNFDTSIPELEISHLVGAIYKIDPNQIQKSYDSTINNDESDCIIQFANSLGMGLYDKPNKLNLETDEIQTQILKGRVINKNQEFKQPQFIVNPNSKNDSSLLIFSCCINKSNWVEEWFQDPEIRQSNLLKNLFVELKNQKDVTKLEKKYHLNRFLNVINSINPVTRTTPLMCACQKSNYSIIKKLIQFSADPTLLDVGGCSALVHYLSIERSNGNETLILDFLLPYSNSVLNIPNAMGQYPINNLLNNFSLLSYMVKKGALIDKNGNFNNLPLAIACKLGYIESIKLLLEKKRLLCSNSKKLVNIDSKNNKNENIENSEANPLDSFTVSQYTILGESLFTYLTVFEELGMEKNSVDSSNFSITKEYESIFEFSIENNNSRLIDYFSKLSVSSQYSPKLRWVKVVLSDNPELLFLLNNPKSELLNIITQSKMNALHLAALKNCIKITPILYQIGVDPKEICLINSSTPIQLAASLGHTNFIKSLLTEMNSACVGFQTLLQSSNQSAGGLSALELSLTNGHVACSLILMQVTNNISLGSPSIQLLKHVTTNTSKLEWNQIEQLCKYLAIFGDSSIKNYDVNNSIFVENTPENQLNNIKFNKMINRLQLLFENVRFDQNEPYSDKSKIERSLKLGFSEEKSNEIISNGWLNGLQNRQSSNFNMEQIISPQLTLAGDLNQLNQIPEINNLFNFIENNLSTKTLSNFIDFINCLIIDHCRISNYFNNQNIKFELSLDKANEFSKILNCLSNINNLSKLLLFDSSIGSNYPWHILISSSIGFVDVLEKVIKSSNHQLFNWFLSIFNSTIPNKFYDSQIHHFKKTIKRFKKFIKLLEEKLSFNSNLLLSFLPDPPQDLQLSFESAAGRYNFKLAIYSIKKQNKLKHIQVSLLSNLPKSTDYIMDCLKKSPIDTLLVCRQTFTSYSLLDPSNNSMDFSNVCSNSLLLLFKGLLISKNKNLDPIIVSNYIENLRLIQMMNSLTSNCKITLIKFFDSILQLYDYNIIGITDTILQSKILNSENSRIEWCRDMQTIISLTPRIVKSIGISYYSNFIKKILDYQKKNQSKYQGSLSLKPSIDITQKLLSPCVSKNIPKLLFLEKSKFEEIDALFKKELEKEIIEKIKQRPFDEVWKSFKSPINKFPMKNDDLNITEKIFKEIETLDSKLRLMNSQSLVSHCKNISDNLSKKLKSNELIDIKDKESIQFSIELLGSLRWLIYNQFGIFPYSTQVCCVIGLLLFSKHPHLKGRIAQVLTGEGKSTIVTLLASYCGMLKRQIDIITTSEYLAIRDFIKYEPFFELLDISCSEICGQNPPKSSFNAQILFGTNTNFEFALLRDKLYDSNLLITNNEPRLKDIVIVDEVDSLFMDSALNSARMAIPSYLNQSFIYLPISKFVFNEFVGPKSNQSNQTIEYSHYVKVKEIIKKEINNLQYNEKSKISINQWIDSLSYEKIKNILELAIKSFKLKEGHDYVLFDQNNKTTIVIVDKDGTGRLSIGCRYSDGLHEFLEVKHGLQPDQETLTAASISHPSFFSQYKGAIFGLTGTCGEEKERDELIQVYSVDSFNVPSYLKSKREDLSPLILNTDKEHQLSIIQETKTMLELSRPVLVLLPTIKESEEFIKILQTKGINARVLNEMQQQDEEFIITKAGECGAVTVATNTAGRGTDIKLTQEALKNGGLHVIFGFYPINLRVECQGLGRAGRQGQNGSSRIMISKESLEIIPNFIIDKLTIEMLNEIRSLKCCQLSNERLLRCKEEKEQYKSLERYFNLLSSLRIFFKSNDFITFIQEILKTKSKSPSSLTKCNCNDQQLSTFYNSAFYSQFIESYKEFFLLEPSDQNNFIHSFANRLEITILDFVQHEWSQFFSTYSSEKLLNNSQSLFDTFWCQESICHCLELFLRDHLKLLLLNLK